MKETAPEEQQSFHKTLLAPVAAVLFIAAVILTLFNLLYVNQSRSAYAFELGEHIDTDPSYYLDGGALAMMLSRADFSEVNMSHTGIYPMSIRYFWLRFDYELAIVDTLAPEITPQDEPLYFVQGTEIAPADFVKSITDADQSISVSFNTDLMEKSSLNCSFPGTYCAWVIARDTSGNSSGCMVYYIVDLPPEIEGPNDYYVAYGENILDHVRVTDLMDGDLSDKVTISEDLSEINERTDTTVTLSVTDSCGFETTRDIRVHMAEPETIQELIGSGRISRSTDVIIGAINVYDTGLLNNRCIEQTMINLIPTVTDIRINEKNGSITTGSGYIIEISDSSIYVVTNKHVVKANTECDVTFYTGDCVTGKVIGVDDDYDIAVVKVSLKDLPDSFEDIISTVHIDMTYWETLDDEKIELGIEKMESDGTISHYTYGTLIKREQYFPFFAPHTETEMSVNLKSGDSGSAVFDKQGRLIGMAFAYSIAPERDWAIPLNEIVDAYEEITGRSLYIY